MVSANFSQFQASSVCLPSDDSEAPDSLNSSEPICIGKTLPAGNVSSSLGDPGTLRGVETSMTLPCGPVPLLCSFRRPFWVPSCAVGRDAASLGAGRAAARAVGGELADASDDCRDLCWRFEGFSAAALPACDTAEPGSESTFLFMPVWTTGLCCCGRGGGGDSGFCVCVAFGVGVALWCCWNA